MFDDFMAKLARRVGENVGKSKIELVRAQVESEFGREGSEKDNEEAQTGNVQAKRQKLEKMAREIGIEDIEHKSSDELINEITDKLSADKLSE